MSPEPSSPPPAQRLSAVPDWTYLLDEIDSVYRYGSAGGSDIIETHRRTVRERLQAVVAADPPLIERTGDPLPVLVHLGRSIDRGSDGPLSGMTRALARVVDSLPWELAYRNVPEKLTRDLGYCELLGPRGPVPCADLILGLVLLAPHSTYPQHSHEDIEESYVTVSGTWSENDAAVYGPGSLILNRDNDEHRLTVGHPGPCLLVYAWLAPPEILATPRTLFDGIPDPA
ncbi:MAG: dimethylsulfonioproprionate lyase family protein [Ornithinimicrobium sp.]